ncbi:Predicted flavoprotein CzcO associated with the cation diffusion facilitator CzcD [Pseudomonas cuatrocienegasensis]|uniref:Predicted flavoprotein CzcO associated with the cation diffusion facilitator CzcD n=1 Tax=Pseudomonas cuatrocienegasensis TaxID=543360 RepID=A0ABY1B1A4_9PSED|nr:MULTISPECIES: NAD(P)/FAD-dependent oxidoreductase [Pseudomonas]OEC36530.1 4-hydroxyacetophenone monooxygenase [Pseudomonas sp. 21C1]SEP68403.1 Predicted flavoprotein CzcO associated with the cation diffusion facilitator CzcD [Pseudomonas cuatrocienegasensis]
MTTESLEQTVLDVLIIGSGFAGIGLAIKLREAGVDSLLILEKAGEIGGTWRDNSYPGAACDVPSHLYSFSFAPKADWTRTFAGQAEIHAYLLDCVARYGLRPLIRCNSEVLGAVFDAHNGQWQVNLAGGQTLRCRALVSACGQLNRPAIPALPGIEQFAGEVFHSARWRHDLDLRGRRVAVIGTGASAIQFVPQLQAQVAHLTLFQRSAAYVLAKPDRAYRPWELALLRRVPGLLRLSRGLKYLQHEVRALAFISFPQLMKLFAWRFRQHLRQAVADPQLRARLQPDYPMGCKRILISNDYYPALAQGNVEVVDSAIEAITEQAVRTADGREHRCDVLIYGTGFAASDFLAPMRITGLGGRDLNQAWQAGAQAYKGISVSGFPNLFLLYGPNTNLGHNSIIYMLESQFRYVLGCVQALKRDKLRYLDVKASVQQPYNQRLQQDLQRTIWSQGCTSWYISATGSQSNNWPGYTFTYRGLTRAPEMDDYDCIR